MTIITSANRIGDTCYIRSCVYDDIKFSDEIRANFNDCRATAASCAGPLAFIGADGWGIGLPLTLCTAAGSFLSKMQKAPTSLSRLVIHQFIEDDILALVYDNGCVVLWSHSGTILHKFSLFDDSTQGHIFDAILIENNLLIARTEDGKIFMVPDIHHLKKFQLDACVLPPKEHVKNSTLTRTMSAANLKSFHSYLDLEFFVIDQNGNVNLITMMKPPSIICMIPEKVFALQVSPDDTKVSFVQRETGTICIKKIDFQKDILSWNPLPELVKPSSKLPDSIFWCNNALLALVYHQKLVLLNLEKQAVIENFEDPTISSRSPITPSSQKLIVLPDQDAIRIYSPKMLEIVLFLDEDTYGVLNRDKNSTVSAILEQRENRFRKKELKGLESQDLKYYVMLQELLQRNQLINVADLCAKASTCTWDISFQKALLNLSFESRLYAQNLEKASRAIPDRDIIAKSCVYLRILNALRRQEIGIPLTMSQLKALSIPKIIVRLSKYEAFDLAFKLAEYTGLSATDALTLWGFQKVAQKVSDDDVVESILKMFSSKESKKTILPYGEVANYALNIGRNTVCDRLIRAEKRIPEKHSIYLKMKDTVNTLMTAAQHENSEIIIETFEQIRSYKSVKDIAKIIKSEIPTSLASIIKRSVGTYLRRKDDLESLGEFLIGTEMFGELIASQISYHMKYESGGILPDFVSILQANARGDHSGNAAFELKAAQFTSVTTSFAKDLEVALNFPAGTLTRLSSTDLLHIIIVNVRDQNQRTDFLNSFRRKLKMPDRRFYWGCLKAMSGIHDVQGISYLSTGFGSGKSSPIGYEPFVEACLAIKERELAVKFCAEITDMHMRARYLAKCGEGKQATEIASKLRDDMLANEISALAAISG